MFSTQKMMRCAALSSVFLVVVACGSDTDDTSAKDTKDKTGDGAQPDVGDGVFESSHPSGVFTDPNGVTRGAGEGGAFVDATTGGAVAVGTPASGPGLAESNAAAPALAEAAPAAPATNPPAPGAEPGAVSGQQAARVIEEADVIKISGDRLYALSALGGLSVVDISNPDKLALLGRHRTTATPFEMYVRDETVFVLYNGYGVYEPNETEDGWTFYQTSYVIALDASDPGQISEQKKFEIEGYIADSRLVGDVMYVAAFDDSYCYRCGSTPETNVMSLDVSDPQKLAKVDELTFAEQESQFGWGRSLSATQDRLYIAGPRWGNAEPEGSLIQVVDIQAASGVMTEGDRLEVAGQIRSRWQMDEFEGVLRVISQPMAWRGESVPQVETFEIQSAQELVPLGQTSLVLPRPETLEAVRFDGPRGYAITFERTDPLFTIDLSDPANPLQLGELEMPGWVYHMEPRGDRLLGLGFDQGNAEGSLTVSVFDVSDLTTPTMLSRVNFGGDWAQLAEDQNRIHKSFQVLDDKELVLVPFSGWTHNNAANGECGGQSSYLSGVQLIDWKADALALQGVAPSQGQARRAFFVGDRLLTMSDERVESFDISDRAAPKASSFVDLAQVVNQVATVGDTVVRVGNSWWDREMEVTVSSLQELVEFAPGARLTLPQLNSETCDGSTWLSEVISGDDQVHFLYNSYSWNNRDGEKQSSKVLTVDVANPNKPSISGDAELEFTPSNGRNYIPGMVDNGRSSLAVGKSLVFAQHDTEYNNLGYITKSSHTLEVVDFSDPDKPSQTTIEMPDALGSTGLISSGSMVASSRFEVSPTNPDSVRFYLDRVDVSKPNKPELLRSVNVPGSLLAYDDEAERALTVDYQLVTLTDTSPKDCVEVEFGTFQTADPSRVDYEKARGDCSALRFTLHLVDVSGKTAEIVDSYKVDKGVRINAAALGSDRVFLGTGATGGHYGGVPTPAVEPGIAIGGPGFWGGRISYYSYGFQTSEAKVLVASGLASSKLTVSSVKLETTRDFYGFNQLIARGDKAVVSTGWQGRLSIIDASDAEEPVVQDSAELAGHVSDLDLAGDIAVAAMGQAGVQTLALDSKE